MFTLSFNEICLHFSETLCSVPRVALCVAVFVILAALSVIDIRKRQIPDILNLAVLVCGIGAIWIFPEIGILSRIIGMFCVGVPLLIFALVIKNSFGMGDVKLMAAAGFLLGTIGVITAFVIGSLLGGVYGALLLVFRRRTAKSSFAFGPCLSIGILISLLFGNCFVLI